MAGTAKDCHALTGYYTKQYTETYGRKPDVNVWSARWGFDAVLRGMSSKEAQELIDYYFTTSNARNHDLDWFFNNYHKLVTARRESEQDKKHIDHLKEESRRRAERWRQSGKRGITSVERGTEEQ